jgi:branched-chain amino acid transport system permease protein
MPVLMAIFGGIGRFYGPILGAIAITLVSDMLLTTFPYYNMLLFGIILVAVIMFFPNGLVGVIRKVSERRSGKVGYAND